MQCKLQSHCFKNKKLSVKSRRSASFSLTHQHPPPTCPIRSSVIYDVLHCEELLFLQNLVEGEHGVYYRIDIEAWASRAAI